MEGPIGVRDSESCWHTEEIGTYMRCWESSGDLPLVIEILVSFRSFRCAPLAKRHTIYITPGNKSNNKITELRAILQRESKNS